jgi:brefeldin A-resistance guanine nucleotide exchange factor 1
VSFSSGPITSAALSSLHKFLSYGFLTRDVPRAREGVNLVARCVPSCIFEETDSESDEVVLMKLLELATLCVQCEASNLLSVRNMWDVYETCYMVGSEKRCVVKGSTLNQLLRAALAERRNF